MALGLSCSTAFGTSLDRGLNPCALRWWVDSYPCATREVLELFLQLQLSGALASPSIFSVLCHPHTKHPLGICQVPIFPWPLKTQVPWEDPYAYTLPLSLGSQMVRTRALKAAHLLCHSLYQSWSGCSESSFKFQGVGSTFSWPLGTLRWYGHFPSRILSLTLCLPVLLFWS